MSNTGVVAVVSPTIRHITKTSNSNFPKTGFSPKQKNGASNDLLNLIMLCGTLSIPLFIYITAKINSRRRQYDYLRDY